MLKASDYHTDNWEETSRSILKDLISDGFSISLYPPDRDFRQWLDSGKGRVALGTISVRTEMREEWGLVWKILAPGRLLE
jgi:hypothetical protein